MGAPAMIVLTAAAGLSVLASSPARAAPPSSGLEGIGRSVSDEDLGAMRGKFVSPSNISYFGVQMQTSWQGPDGVTTSATLLFAVDFAKGAGQAEGATPLLMISWNREGDPAMDVPGFGEAAAGDYVAIALPGDMAIGGLGGVQGAVQSQQIAGSDNRVRNDMRIAIVPAAAIQGASGNGLTQVSGSQSQQFANGDTLQFILADNEVALALTGGGPDQVRQSFNGEVGQAAQHVLLASSNNAIHNSMGITVGYNQLEQAGRVSVQNALTAMKGLGF